MVRVEPADFRTMVGMEGRRMEPGGAVRCYRHPDRPTVLRCSKCDRPICGFCSREAPVGQRCPDCMRGSGVTRVVAARRFSGGLTPAVLAIIAVSVIAYLLQRLIPQITFEFAHITQFVQQGEWWRPVTAAFLHSRGSVLHILFNMYALYLFGPRLERQVGTVAFVGLYLASALGGGVAFQFLSEGGAVGASGAIFGLFGAVLVGTYPLRRTPQGANQFRRLLLLLGINLALPLLVPGIAWEAHVGGLVMGMIVVSLWQHIPPGPRAPLSRRLVVYGLAAVALLLIVAA